VSRTDEFNATADFAIGSERSSPQAHDVCAELW
jgi:hypothetical protein